MASVLLVAAMVRMGPMLLVALGVMAVGEVMVVMGV